MESLVSVIVPCFNHAHYLPEALDSVRRQTYQHTEVVVVDDASTDSTREVAGRAAGVHYLRRSQNGGLAMARNDGLASARGEFVVFLDADDWLLPNAIEAGLRASASDPETGFVFGSFRYVRASGESIGEREPLDLEGDCYRALLSRNVVEMISTALFRRAAIAAVGGLDTRLRACEDYDLMLRIARHHRVRQHDAVIACYRMHGQNMSRDHARMLRFSLRALRKQRREAILRPDWHRAYREGIEFWRCWYGRLLWNDIVAQVAERRDLWQAMLRTVLLAREVGVRRLARWRRGGEEETMPTLLPP